MTINEERYSKLAEKIHARYPDSQIKYKDINWFWKLMPNRLRLSGTTLGKTIWMPNRNPNFYMLGHEYQHLEDFYSLGIVGMLMLYTRPQNLAGWFVLCAVLGLGFHLYLFAIIMLAFIVISLLPWPSKDRAEFEIKGYQANLYIANKLGAETDKVKDYIVDSLTSWLYYKMVWTKKTARELMNRALVDIDNVPKHGTALRDIHEIIIDTTS